MTEYIYKNNINYELAARSHNGKKDIIIKSPDGMEETFLLETEVSAAILAFRGRQKKPLIFEKNKSKLEILCENASALHKVPIYNIRINDIEIKLNLNDYELFREMVYKIMLCP